MGGTQGYPALAPCEDQHTSGATRSLSGDLKGQKATISMGLCARNTGVETALSSGVTPPKGSGRHEVAARTWTGGQSCKSQGWLSGRMGRRPSLPLSPAFRTGGDQGHDASGLGRRAAVGSYGTQQAGRSAACAPAPGPGVGSLLPARGQPGPLGTLGPAAGWGSTGRGAAGVF